jgi:hypothetical protein
MEEYTIGGYSPSLDANNEHTVINAEYPTGRYTTDLELAKQWAQEFCEQANQDPNAPAHDFEPRVWVRINYSNVWPDPTGT